MPGKYRVWEFDSPGDRNFCVLSDLVEVEDDYELTKGVSRLNGFPDDVEYHMDPEFPKDVELADNLINTASLIVVSSSLRKFIESKTTRNIEYLPVTIVNHKGKPASADYFLLNPIGLQSCIDTEKSGVTWDTLFPDEFDRIERLVINEDEVDKDVKIFRPAGYSRVVLVEAHLAEEILAGGFTGIRWVETSDYPEN